MADEMESFLATQNIMNFRLQLQKETHPDKRRILLQLLANEVAKHPEAVQRAHALMTVSSLEERSRGRDLLKLAPL